MGKCCTVIILAYFLSCVGAGALKLNRVDLVGRSLFPTCVTLCEALEG